ncbi:hypothetical protein Tco_1271351 [Tanacetum coccineum]
MKAVQSSSHALIVPLLSSSSHVIASPEFVNVFVRIGFNSTIKLVSFDESQVVTLNGKFVCGFRNGGSFLCSNGTLLFHRRSLRFRVSSGSGSGSTSSELEARVCVQGSYMVQFSKKMYGDFEKGSG